VFLLQSRLVDLHLTNKSVRSDADEQRTAARRGCIRCADLPIHHPALNRWFYSHEDHYLLDWFIPELPGISALGERALPAGAICATEVGRGDDSAVRRPR
jgi:hypothetical protein